MIGKGNNIKVSEVLMQPMEPAKFQSRLRAPIEVQRESENIKGLDLSTSVQPQQVK